MAHARPHPPSSTAVTTTLTRPYPPEGLMKAAIPDAELNRLTVGQIDVGPLENLTLGQVAADQVRAADITAPVSDFTINGLTLGGVSLEGIVLPDASIGTTTVAHLQGQAFPLGSLTIPGVDLPATNAG